MSIYDKASLVLIPSGTKTSKVYSQVPTNGDGDFTFSRSTAATRVNASGNIEKETQNLLLHSNTFDITWSGSASTLSGQSGYDGSSDAWLITKSGTFDSRRQVITNSGVATFSVYAKAGSYDWLLLHIEDSAGDCLANFDLSTATLGSLTNGITSKIEDVGSGWYRCSATFNRNVTDVRIYPSESGSYTGTSGSIYIQDAQLEQGLVARDYIETTTTAIYGGITDNVPRLDYTDSSCPALLLEPQRTNELIFSEYYGSGWSQFNTTITQNDTTSPEGVQNASKIVANSGTNEKYISEFGLNTTINTQSVVSAFVKDSGLTYASLRFTGADGAFSAGSAWFNLSTGAKGSADASIENYDIEDYGNGWYRIWASSEAIATSSNAGVRVQLTNTDGGALAFTGDGTSGTYVYGVQYEAGSYPTSYIPTYGSAVTRNSDGLITLSNLANLSEGTMFFELDGQSNRDADFRFQLTRNTGESSNRIFLAYSGDSKARCYCISGGSIQADLNSSTIITSGTIKIAVTFKENDIRLFFNGVKTNTDTSALIPTGLDEIILGVGTATGGVATKDMLKQVMLFPTALTDQEAIDLTTL